MFCARVSRVQVAYRLGDCKDRARSKRLDTVDPIADKAQVFRFNKKSRYQVEDMEVILRTLGEYE